MVWVGWIAVGRCRAFANTIEQPLIDAAADLKDATDNSVDNDLYTRPEALILKWRRYPPWTSHGPLPDSYRYRALSSPSLTKEGC